MPRETSNGWRRPLTRWTAAVGLVVVVLTAVKLVADTRYVLGEFLATHFGWVTRAQHDTALDGLVRAVCAELYGEGRERRGCMPCA